MEILQGHNSVTDIDFNGNLSKDSNFLICTGSSKLLCNKEGLKID